MKALKAWCTCIIVVLVIKPIALLTFSLPSLSSNLKVPNIILSPPLGNTELSASLLTFARLLCQGLPSKLVCGRTSSVCKYHPCEQRPLLFPAKYHGEKASASREVKCSTVEQKAACLISRAGPILRVWAMPGGRNCLCPANGFTFEGFGWVT